jgi:hypothetical protein
VESSDLGFSRLGNNSRNTKYGKAKTKIGGATLCWLGLESGLQIPGGAGRGGMDGAVGSGVHYQADRVAEGPLEWLCGFFAMTAAF